MALPTDRTSFGNYILRKLGAPVIRINMDPSQLDDRIDEALLYWYDYAFEGTEKTYYKYQLTQTDFDNKYITLPDNIIGAVRIFDISVVSSNIQNPFNIQYQIVMNDLYNIASISLVPFYTTFEHLQFIQQMLIGLQPVRYNRNTNKFWIDMDWTRLEVGNFVIVEAYQVIDPNDFPDVWHDRQLLAYATALVKRQWGENLKKFSGVETTGGITLNGQQIFDEAMIEIEKLEQQMRDSSLPATDMIG